MSAMGRLFRRKPRPSPAIEHRVMQWPAATLGGLNARSVDTIAASNLTAYIACIDLISKAVAGLPASIMRDDGRGGRVPAPGAPASRLLTRPSKHQPWPSYISTVVGSLLEHGNSVSLIQTDGRGNVTGLVHVPYAWLAPVILQSDAGARLAFDLRQITAQSTLLGIPRRMISGEDCVHVMMGSADGIVGRGVLERAPRPIQAALEINEWAAQFYRNGTAATGVVSLPPNISKPGMDRLEAWFTDKYTGIDNVGRPLFLDAGSEFTPLSATSVEAQVLESRRFAVEEICRLFGVPVELVMSGTSAPASLTPYLAAFATMSVGPLVQLIEWAFDDILPVGEHLFLDTAGLVRGDWTAVAAAQAVLVQSGIATANDARRAIGLQPHKDGDALRVGSPPSYPADATGSPSLAPKPGPGGNLPNVGTHQNEGRG